METYPINLTPGNGGAYQIPATGDLFVYESATTAGDVRIRVKPDTGGEIILKPGQRFRTPERTTMWTIRLVGTDPVAGFLIIGEGDFDDANTLNKVTLDAQFANNVTVMNSAANRVPVSMDPAQLLQQQAPLMAYTNSASVTVTTGTPGKLIDAAQNVNGVIVELLLVQNAAYFSALTAKVGSVAPANYKDGDVIAGAAGIPFGSRIKVAAGKSVWATTNSSATDISVLYTVL